MTGTRINKARIINASDIQKCLGRALNLEFHPTDYAPAQFPVEQLLFQPSLDPRVKFEVGAVSDEHGNHYHFFRSDMRSASTPLFRGKYSPKEPSHFNRRRFKYAYSGRSALPSESDRVFTLPITLEEYRKLYEAAQ